MSARTIGGVVLEAGTRRPLGGWYVEAFDGGSSMSALGWAVTAGDGSFTIHCERRASGRRRVWFRVAGRPGQAIVHEAAALDSGGSHHEILVPPAAGERRRPTEGGRPG